MQPGDVPATAADVDDLASAVGFSPGTSIEDGIARFVAGIRVLQRLRRLGALPPVLLDKRNTARDVWADTAYRSNANERHLANNRPALARTARSRTASPCRPIARANGRRSKVRAAVEHVFAHQKGPMGLVVRTIGLARARVKISLANLVFNMKRMIWLTRPLAAAVRRISARPALLNPHRSSGKPGRSGQRGCCNSSSPQTPAHTWSASLKS